MKVFIINLKRAVERKELMLSQIQSSGLIKSNELEFIFFDAIDAKQNQHIKFKNERQSFVSKIIIARYLFDGEIACFASHFLLWQKCIELNEPIVVLEDDIEFLPEFENGLKKISESSFEYVRFICTFEKKMFKIEENFYKSYYAISGAQGYYLTPTAAQKFINKAKKWYKPVDDYMDSFWINNVPNIVHTPFLIKGIDIDSTIIDRVKKKTNIFFKITHEISHICLVIRKFCYIYLKLNLN
jgi:glycosyl transferase family 25